MKNTILIILAMALSFGLGFFLSNMIADKPIDKTITEQNDKNPEMQKVTGIGGIFFKCKNPDKLKEWYKIHLGFNTNQFGTRFEWMECPDKKEGIQWSPFSETGNYFAPSTKEFMINYRVENLDNLVEQLKKEGVEFTDSIETYEYGKFVHIMDIEGNKIELYEPNYDFGKTDD
jgi:predicted enzyme related to lactoylglutathione lyase